MSLSGDAVPLMVLSPGHGLEKAGPKKAKKEEGLLSSHDGLMNTNPLVTFAQLECLSVGLARHLMRISLAE